MTTNESFRFYNNKFDEMPCELDASENPRSFEKCQLHLRALQAEGLSLSPGRDRCWTRGPQIDQFFSIFREIGRLTRPI